MKIYNLNSKLDFGEYKGKTMKEVFIEDPEYIEECILDVSSFCFNPANIETLEDMNDEFAFSQEAVDKLESKFDAYEEQENKFDDVENFIPEDLKDFSFDEDLDDDYDDPAGYYEDGYGY
ncbi:MAG: hypothetical protein ACOCWA_00545 [Bacteroidota bacterium]